MKWLEMSVTDADPRTDAVLYKEKSNLLIPESGNENQFRVISSFTSRTMYIGSTSQKSLERMQAFFYKLYGAAFENAAPKIQFEKHLILVNSWWDRKMKDFYHPEFVRNLLDLSASSHDLVWQYGVNLLGSYDFRRRRRYNFLLTLSFRDEDELGANLDLIRDQIAKLSENTAWKMHRLRTRGISDNLMKNTFNLINFIRIPAKSEYLI